ncbi:hypothetical protein PHLGIDRAFT_128820 [Phlebiopsis gigantea 11061_1 CR5-6]|uniref:histidine kinase n=1 Tax=Phlebiopsis gigantea (strain 11061_1 CR5-6) TaxID=745531 RepID=A0A0C3S8R4_PHLG1|nr:hypothetical protein PHLGIDRAFT_128820 [Phlebiopsis gigantea 11061_1 CR5-6]
MTASSSYHLKSKATPADATDATTTRAATPTDDEEDLPPPVQATVTFGDRRRKQKRTRISLGLHVHWDRFLRKLGSGTAPSTSSALDESSGDSIGYNRSRLGAAVITEDAEVDEVVVDREWSGDIKSSVHSGHGGTPEKSHVSNQQMGYGGTSTDRDSVAIHADGFWTNNALFILLRYRLWSFIYSFFCTRFLDAKSEAHYKKENWFLRKSLALWVAGFYVLNWALATGFIPHPADLADKIFYYGVTPAATFPLFFMVVYDFPRDRPVLYQCYLAFSTWSWSCYQILFMYLCGFYLNHPRFSCENKDFLTTFYYTSALQTLAIFGLGLNRLPALLGVVVFTGLSCGLIVPIHTTFVRNVIIFLIFQGFLLYVHYMRENAERRLYTLRDQLKIQFRATQKAQVNERKASDSKRRLTSYVFHEVRVPLNTALLAVQNMEASGTVAKEQEIEFKALEGSLSMMSKVLNDVLDFNRMDSGRFESVLKVMRSLFVPLRLATDARGLEFITNLDTTIDKVARKAFYETRGESPEAVARHLSENPDEEGIVVGDETRLRQIITNLASNACKFTPTGGQLLITTKLVIPNLTPDEDMDEEDAHNDFPTPGFSEKEEGDALSSTAAGSEGRAPHEHPGLSRTLLSQHDVMHSKPSPLEWIVVRIEVTDTGCGIRQKDMVQTKLFSAFNQTEMGRQQGGKGTGLGLALVRQIVKRSGGRLGVRSRFNEGSTFWVELPLGVGGKVAAGLSTPDGRINEQFDMSTGKVDYMSPRASTSSRSPVPVHAPVSSPTAMHSIMEQGGLVEIQTGKEDQGARVPTRTIGDPSTGTDPTPTRNSFTPTSSPEPTTPADRPLTAPEDNSDATLKPTHLELPRPRDFAVEGREAGVAHAALAASVLTPGSTTSTAAFSTSTGSSAQLERGIRVLVVDDDPLTRKLMSRMLTRLGCKVTTAENGEIALDLILNPAPRLTPSSEDTGSSGLVPGDSSAIGDERYGVVFLDNQMPVMSGIEATAKLRALGRKDFVVGVTGNALLSDQQEYLEAGVDHVLTKPVLEKSLKAMLAIADERRRRGMPSHEHPSAHS